MIDGPVGVILSVLTKGASRHWRECPLGTGGGSLLREPGGGEGESRSVPAHPCMEWIRLMDKTRPLASALWRREVSGGRTCVWGIGRGSSGLGVGGGRTYACLGACSTALACVLCCDLQHAIHLLILRGPFLSLLFFVGSSATTPDYRVWILVVISLCEDQFAAAGEAFGPQHAASRIAGPGVTLRRACSSEARFENFGRHLVLIWCCI